MLIVSPECRVWTTCAAGLYCRGELGSISTGECAPQLAEGSACFPHTDSCATGNCACASGNCVSDPGGGFRCAPPVSCE
jgi:hypothetical protein